MNENVIACAAESAEKMGNMHEDVKAGNAKLDKVLQISQGGNATPEWLKEKPLEEQRAYWEQQRVMAASHVRKCTDQKKEQAAAVRELKRLEKEQQKAEKAVAAEVSLRDIGSFLHPSLGPCR